MPNDVKEVVAVDFKPQQNCSRCGRKGHIQAKCWSRTDKDGKPIESTASTERPKKLKDKKTIQCFRCGENHRIQQCPYTLVKTDDDIKLVRKIYFRKSKENLTLKGVDFIEEKPTANSNEDQKETKRDGTRAPEVIHLKMSVDEPRGISAFDGRVDIELGNRQLTTLIDSGASVSLIAENVLTEKERERVIHKSTSLKTANSSTLETTGQLEAEIRIGKEGDHTVKFLTTNQTLPEDVILGRDAQALMNYKITPQGLELGSSTIKWKNQRFPVRAKYTTKIPAKGCCVVAVIMHDTRPEKKHNQLYQTRSHHEAKFECEHGVFSNSRKLIITNTSDQDRFLKKGSVICLAEPLENSSICNIEECSEEEAEKLIVKMRQKGLLEREDSGQSYQKVRINSKLSEEQQMKLRELVFEFRDIFAEVLSKPADLPAMPIDLTSPEPVVWRPSARVPFKWRPFVDDMIEQALQQGIIRRSNSAFSAPIVVTMSAGKLRMCIDYRGLNLKTAPLHSIVPRIDEIFIKLRGANFISTSDCTLGYNQMKVQEKDVHKTAFSCHKGQFEYLYAPLGLKNVPRYYNDGMRKAFESFEFVQTYFDDLSCFSKTFDEHLEHLRKMFERCREKNITLKGSKTNLGFDSIDYLGHEVSGTTIRPRREKAEAIKDFPRPKNLKSAIEFISMANYYRQFVPRFSEVAHGLQNMINNSRQRKRFEWNQEAERSFEELKQLISQRIALTIPDPQKKFTVTIDSSEKGWGLELKQDNRIIEFNSGTFNDTQRRYGPCERECLGIILGLEKIKDYLVGGKFDLYTDCRAIRWLRESKNDSSKLFRWSLRLSEFDANVIHIPGKLIPHADAISRNPISHTQNTEVNAIENFKSWSSFKKRIQKLFPNAKIVVPKKNEINHAISEAKVSLKEGTNTVLVAPIIPSESWFSELLQHKVFFIQDAISITEEDAETAKNFIAVLFSDHGDGTSGMIAIPKKFRRLIENQIDAEQRSELLRAAHDHPWASHAGINRTMKKLEKFKPSWPNMEQDVTEYIKSCDICQKNKVFRAKSKAVGQFQKTKIPFERICTDVVGSLPVTSEGYRYVLFVICSASRWVELVPLKTTDACTVLKALYDVWITKYGPPKEILSDNSLVFDGNEARKFWQDHGITKIMSSPYHQATNGLAERNISTMVDQLRCQVHNQSASWNQHLQTVAAGMRAKTCAENNLTPFQYVFGCEMNSPWHTDESKRVELTFRLLNWLKTPEEPEQVISKYVPGDWVLVKNSNRKSKFESLWIGPFRVKKKISNHLFEIEKDGRVIRRHTDLIKKYWRREEHSEGEGDDTSNNTQQKKKEKEYEVEKIVDSKMHEGERLYRVRWKGFDEKEDTWEPLAHFKKLFLVRKFHKTNNLPI